VQCGWSPFGQVVRCGGLWTEQGDRRWAVSRGGGWSPPRTSCPRAGHRLSTNCGSSVHRPRRGHPQSCPQMWVKSGRAETLRDRFAAPNGPPGASGNSQTSLLAHGCGHSVISGSARDGTGVYKERRPRAHARRQERNRSDARVSPSGRAAPVGAVSGPTHPGVDASGSVYRVGSGRRHRTSAPDVDSARPRTTSVAHAPATTGAQALEPMRGPRAAGGGGERREVSTVVRSVPGSVPGQYGPAQVVTAGRVA
jgi:hypothetical protein